MSDFIRVPPDSTGKKVRNSRTLDISVSNIVIQTLNTLKIGDYIVSTSGGNGFYNGYTISQRDVFTIYLKDFLGVFNVGDDLSFNAVVFGVITSYDDVYTQKSVITDNNSPTNTLKVDDNGSAYIRFNDGNINLDVFGNLITSGRTTLKSYVFYYGRDETDFVDLSENGGQIVEEPQNSQIKLVTGTSAGSKSSTTTFLYFPYLPQHSNTISMSVALGDNGKENVVRRWGLFDDEDGLYFEVNNNILSVNIRNSITNQVHSVPQSEFNENSLLSDVLDIFELDVTKYNLYWISYQWQGVGVVKFGMYSPFGDRIVLHTFQNPNNNILPYMKRGTLPIRIEQLNTGISASTSEIKSSCIIAVRDSDKLEYVGNIVKYASTPKLVTDTLTPLVTLRLSEFVNGEINRTLIHPYELQYFSETNPIKVEYLLNADLTGPIFNPYTKFSEVDDSSSAVNNGFLFDTDLYGVGLTKERAVENLDFTILNSVPGIQNTITIAARTIIPATTSIVHVIGKWREIQ